MLPGIEVAVGCADTHRLDLLDAAHLVDDDVERIDRCVHIILFVVVGLCLDGCRSLDFTTRVDDAEHRVGAAEVETNDVWFHCVLFVHDST